MTVGYNHPLCCTPPRSFLSCPLLSFALMVTLFLVHCYSEDPLIRKYNKGGEWVETRSGTGCGEPSRQVSMWRLNFWLSLFKQLTYSNEANQESAFRQMKTQTEKNIQKRHTILAETLLCTLSNRRHLSIKQAGPLPNSFKSWPNKAETAPYWARNLH